MGHGRVLEDAREGLGGLSFPRDWEAEQVVLGAALLDPQISRWVARHAQVDDFHLSAHRDIFAAVVEAVGRDREADLVNVGRILREAGRLECNGGAEYLTALLDAVPTVVHARRELPVLRRLRLLRELMEQGAELMRRAAGPEADPGRLAQETVGWLRGVEDRLVVDERAWVTAEAAMAHVRALRWLWPGWVPRGHLTLLIAQPGVGKSALALHLAGCATRGACWPDGAAGPEPGPVLYCDTEAAQSQLLERVRAWGLPPQQLLLPGADGMHRLELHDPASLSLALRLVEREGVGVVIIDSLRNAFVGDENSSEVAALLGAWVEAAAQQDFALLVVHHLRKRKEGEGARITLERIRGSSALPALARSIIALSPLGRGLGTVGAEDGADPAPVRVEVIKANFSRLPPPLLMTIAEDGLRFAPHHLGAGAAESDDAGPPRRLVVERYLLQRLAAGPLPVRELLRECREHLGASPSTVYQARTALGLLSLPDPAVPTGRLWALADQVPSAAQPPPPQLPLTAPEAGP